VWRKGQCECGFECEVEKYPHTPSQTHTDFSSPPAFTVLGVGIECVKYISHTHTSNSRCFFGCEVEKYPYTRSQTLCAKGVSLWFLYAPRIYSLGCGDWVCNVHFPHSHFKLTLFFWVWRRKMSLHSFSNLVRQRRITLISLTRSHSHTGFFSSEKSLRRRRRTLRLEREILFQLLITDKIEPGTSCEVSLRASGMSRPKISLQFFW
jgi:hypothetical protein